MKDLSTLAQAYYTAVAEKKINEIGKFLHPEVQFIGPLAKANGKETVLETVKNFTTAFLTLTIRALFDSENQAMLVYDVDFPAPIGNTTAAALLTFQEGLISKFEIIYDPRPFDFKPFRL